MVRGCNDREPVTFVPTSAPAEVRELDHDRGALLMHGVGHFPDPRHDFVLVGQQIVEDRGAVFRDCRRPGGHRQRHAALGPLDRIGTVAALWHTVFRIGRLVRRDDDAVAQGQMLQLKWLKQGVVRHATGSGLWDFNRNGMRNCTHVSIIKNTIVCLFDTRVHFP
ncbi:hypothetical protein D9M72_371780 [compost metagenome]